MFFWSPSLKRGTVYIFRPNSDQGSQRIPLKGLAPETQYHIRSEDGSVAEETSTGKNLMTAGIKVKLPGKYTSDLIYLKQVK
jgi:hypothetical protein